MKVVPEPDGDRWVDQPPDHRLDAVDDLAEIDGPGRAVPAAAERLEQPGQLAAAFDDMAHGGGIHRDPSFGIRPDELGVAGRDRQRLAEVVGDAAGKEADRADLLGLEQLRLESGALGDVDELTGDADRLAVMVDQPGGVDVDPALPAVLRQP